MRIVEAEALGFHYAEQHAQVAGAGLLAENLQVVDDCVLGVPRHGLHQAVVFTDGAGDGFELGSVRKRARNGSPVRQPMRRQAIV